MIDITYGSFILRRDGMIFRRTSNAGKGKKMSREPFKAPHVQLIHKISNSLKV